MQAQWKALLDEAQAPLREARQLSLDRRRALIEQAQELGAQNPLRIDAVRALQQRWQHEAQQVPIDRRQEQKLWDAFRKPIDEAFARKSVEREQAMQAMLARARARTMKDCFDSSLQSVLEIRGTASAQVGSLHT